MRQLATSEKLQLRELLQMESDSLAKTKAVMNIIEDDELKATMRTGVQAAEARIKGIQQFIQENDIIAMEVH